MLIFVSQEQLGRAATVIFMEPDSHGILWDSGGEPFVFDIPRHPVSLSLPFLESGSVHTPLHQGEP